MAGDPLLRRIRHAEDWLRRARHDWRGGNAPAAILRLMLAEAEIRYARETGAEAIAQGRGEAGRRPSWPRAAAAIAAAAVLAAGLGYVSMQMAMPHNDALAGRDGPAAGISLRGGAGGGGITRTIVQLDTGQFLMPDRGRTPAGEPGGPGSAGLQLAVPVDLRTPSPTF